jgi:hypothetical protein
VRGVRLNAIEFRSIRRMPESVTERQMPWKAKHDWIGGLGLFC